MGNATSQFFEVLSQKITVINWFDLGAKQKRYYGTMRTSNFGCELRASQNELPTKQIWMASVFCSCPHYFFVVPLLFLWFWFFIDTAPPKNRRFHPSMIRCNRTWLMTDDCLWHDWMKQRTLTLFKKSLMSSPSEPNFNTLFYQKSNNVVLCPCCGLFLQFHRKVTKTPKKKWRILWSFSI